MSIWVLAKNWRAWRTLLVAATALGLAGCAESQLLVHTAKRIAQPDQVRRPVGQYKVGTPYQISGVWYYPAEDYAYDQTGIASWYGPKFDRKQTANGEIFDMNELSAAHRTLPMPSFVQVTNLENGRSLRLRINDRGPFARGRIIDISRRGAQLLGFERKGTARVRVSILARDSRAIALRLKGGSSFASRDGLPIKASIKAAKPRVSARGLAPPPGARVAPGSGAGGVHGETYAAPRPAQVASRGLLFNNVGNAQETGLGAVAMKPVEPTSIYVQVGAFTLYENAHRVTARLFGYNDFKISSVIVGGREFFRVRAGPLGTVEKADRILDYTIRTGYPGAKIIVD